MEGQTQDSTNVTDIKASTDVFRPSSMGVKVNHHDELLRTILMFLALIWLNFVFDTESSYNDTSSYHSRGDFHHHWP